MQHGRLRRAVQPSMLHTAVAFKRCSVPQSAHLDPLALCCPIIRSLSAAGCLFVRCSESCCPFVRAFGPIGLGFAFCFVSVTGFARGDETLGVEYRQVRRVLQEGAVRPQAVRRSTHPPMLTPSLHHAATIGVVMGLVRRCCTVCCWCIALFIACCMFHAARPRNCGYGPIVQCCSG